MGPVITLVRDTRESQVADLRADYARSLRLSGRDPAVFRARVEIRMRGLGLEPSPEGWATAARGVQLVHLGCDGRGCPRCAGRGWHSGARPLHE